MGIRVLFVQQDQQPIKEMNIEKIASPVDLRTTIEMLIGFLGHGVSVAVTK